MVRLGVVMNLIAVVWTLQYAFTPRGAAVDVMWLVITVAWFMLLSVLPALFTLIADIERRDWWCALGVFLAATPLCTALLLLFLLAALKGFHIDLDHK